MASTVGTHDVCDPGPAPSPECSSNFLPHVFLFFSFNQYLHCLGLVRLVCLRVPFSLPFQERLPFSGC